MSEMNAFTFDRLLEVLAEKLASKLLQEPSRLYPRLLTADQGAVYLGRSRAELRKLVEAGRIPTVRADSRVLLDRLDLDRWIEQQKECAT
jgi:excisionase family DNA binding protein